MRRRKFRASDVAILFGILLLICSVIGIYAEPVLSAYMESPASPQDDGSQGKTVLQVVKAPTILPTIAPFTPVPSLTPFQAEQPTMPALPVVPETAVVPAAGVPATRAGGVAVPQATPTTDTSYLVPVNPQPTATALPPARTYAPTRLVIPSIGLDAPVVAAAYQLVDIQDSIYQQWEPPPEYAAGWQFTSAPLGVPGNTVLIGHHNIFGEVFGKLIDLNPGDTIRVYSGGNEFVYVVANKMILDEKGESMSVRLNNARWLSASQDERLTLVSCWPLYTNTHRIIIVARPVSKIIQNP